MNFLNCPITNEIILKITPRGIYRTNLYSEIFFNLTDGSKMRIPISKNVKKNLKDKQLKDLFEKIRKERLSNLKAKELPRKEKEACIIGIEKIGFKNVIDKRGNFLNKVNKKNGNN